MYSLNSDAGWADMPTPRPDYAARHPAALPTESPGRSRALKGILAVVVIVGAAVIAVSIYFIVQAVKKSGKKPPPPPAGTGLGASVKPALGAAAGTGVASAPAPSSSELDAFRASWADAARGDDLTKELTTDEARAALADGSQERAIVVVLPGCGGCTSLLKTAKGLSRDDIPGGLLGILKVSDWRPLMDTLPLEKGMVPRVFKVGGGSAPRPGPTGGGDLDRLRGFLRGQ